MTDDWKIVSTSPVVQADVLEAMPALMRLRYANPRPPARKRFVLLRWADVVRRFSPDDALSVLLEELPDAEDPKVGHLTRPAVLAATYLELQRLDEARECLPRVERRGGARELLEGRIALQRGLLDEAESLYQMAIAAARLDPHPLSVEVEVEAMGHRARLALARHLPADGLLAAVDTRLAELNAGISQSLFRSLNTHDSVKAQEVRLDRSIISIREHLLQTYGAPHESIREQLAPIPPHVHGMAQALRLDPMKYVSAVSTLASIQWRAGDRQRGYETAAYGLAIGRRLFNEEVSSVLEEFIERLVAPLPPEQRGAYAWRLEQNAAELLRTRAAADG